MQREGHKRQVECMLNNHISEVPSLRSCGWFLILQPHWWDAGIWSKADRWEAVFGGPGTIWKEVMSEE